jgi:aminopeptidase N
MVRNAAAALLVLFMSISISACGKKQAAITPPKVVNYSYANPSEVSVQHMDMNLDVDFDKKVLTGSVGFLLDNKKKANVITFDTWALNIRDVVLEDDQGNEKKARFVIGDSLELIGRPLSVVIEPGTRRVTVKYQTTAAARGLQWLSPEQTAGKQQPYMYTQSEAIHARSWVPCQDTPAVRFTYTANIHVPNQLMALMSAENSQRSGGDGNFRFEMKQPIPSYLLALAVGNIQFRPISDRTGVYSEPEMVDKAKAELSDLEKMVQAAEKLNGPYRWGRYDVLVLPPSFPLGGMENPRLTFCTPIIIAGDKSLVSLITHELAHSWSGNLVTNATWNDFWLNEGFTTYVERRIDEALYGREYAQMQDILGMRDLNDEWQEIGKDSQDCALYTEYKGRNPDEVPTMAAYEKANLFLTMMEDSLGRANWDKFLKQYFDTFAFKTMTTKHFVRYLKDNVFADDSTRYDALKIDEWIYKPGIPSNAPRLESKRFDEVDAQITAFKQGVSAKNLHTSGWTVIEWQRFLDNLPQPMPVARIQDLDETYHLSDRNAAIQRSWFPSVIAAGYQPAYPALENYLVTIGRRFYVRPIYMDLAKTPAGLEFARQVYKKARPGYHPMTQTGIDLVLYPDKKAAP